MLFSFLRYLFYGNKPRIRCARVADSSDSSDNDEENQKENIINF